jgi:hypothetical protein
MKQTMGTKKRADALQLATDTNFNWDSLETRANFYTEEIKKINESLSHLSILDDARQIVTLCGKLKLMKNKLRRGW